MRILIFGATGFIGSHLVKFLTNKHDISIITRNHANAIKIFPNNVKIYEWDFENIEILANLIENIDVIINLAGENISSKLWTKKQKQKIIESRVILGGKIISAITKVKNKPIQFIQASAIGYYGFTFNEKVNETGKKGIGFLSDVCELWEKSTEKVIENNVKRVIIRIGVVLGNNGGIMIKLLNSIKYFMGINFGNGKNIVSWIHVNDFVRAIEFLIKTETKGIYNLTSPNPVNSRTINNIIAKQLKRPIWFNIHKRLLSLFFGSMAKELLLANQNVIPDMLLKDGFKFNYSNINDTICSLIEKAARKRL